jgi:hypothetical protein
MLRTKLKAARQVRFYNTTRFSNGRTKTHKTYRAGNKAEDKTGKKSSISTDNLKVTFK